MSRDFPYRKNVRLLNFDYSSANAYFVTICTQFRECLFGEVVAGQILLNDLGKIVEATWNDLPNHNRGIELDEFVVMPNHIHGIIIVGAGSKPARAAIYGPAPFGTATGGLREWAGLEPAPTVQTPLSEIVRQLKTFSARRINKIRGQSMPLWQRNYYEHVIRDEFSFDRIREYIVNNPLEWEFDENNPRVRAGLEPAPTTPPTTVTNHKSSRWL